VINAPIDGGAVAGGCRQGGRQGSSQLNRQQCSLPRGMAAEHGRVGGGIASVLAAVFFVVLAIVLSSAGCSRTQQPKMPLTPGVPDPVAEAKSLMESYGAGQPLGSEIMNFDDLVKRVTAADAPKGEKLKAFADEVLKKGKVDAAKAKKLAAEL